MASSSSHGRRRGQPQQQAQTRKRRENEKVTLMELGSYEKILATFRTYDIDRNGVMTFAELHMLMADLNDGNWTEAESDKLFVQLDKNRNGAIDIDEFLEFCFGKGGGGGTMGPVGKSDYERVVEEFRKVDTNRNGTLDQAEFTRLMVTLNPGKWSREMTDRVFSKIDLDNSGEVDMTELVAFIFGVPQERANAARRSFSSPTTSRTHVGHDALVVIDMTCGKGGPEVAVQQIANSWNKNFGKDVAVRKTVDPMTKTISKVTARNGEVIFWDLLTMVAYRDNPFLTMGTMRAWTEDMTRRHIPRLLQGASYGVSMEKMDGL